MRKYQAISADGHMEIPLDWTSRVAARFKDLVPHLVRRPDGSEVWLMDQWQRENTGNLYCGTRYDEWNAQTGRTYHNPDGSLKPGTGDPVQRLREQDQDGIDAEILYYPVYGPDLMRNMLKKDKEAYLAIVQAYNTYLAEFCSVAPDRLLGSALVPESGVDDAVREIERVRKAGLLCASPTMWPNGGPDPMPEQDDRFWAAVCDLDIKMSPHINFGGPVPLGNNHREYCVTGSGKVGLYTHTIGRLMLHGTLDRFPKLTFHFAETGASWLPYFLDWVDEVYLRWHKYHDVHLRKLPSSYWRDHCMFSFIVDRMAMRMRDYIPAHMLLWGSDLPHGVGTFPDSHDMLEDMFYGVPEEDRRRVLVLNPCRFMGLDPNRDITPTP